MLALVAQVRRHRNLWLRSDVAVRQVREPFDGESWIHVQDRYRRCSSPICVCCVDHRALRVCAFVTAVTPRLLVEQFHHDYSVSSSSLVEVVAGIVSVALWLHC